MSDLHTMCDEGNAFVERMRETHPDLANRDDVAALGATTWGMFRAMMECPVCPGRFRQTLGGNFDVLICKTCGNVWYHKDADPAGVVKTLRQYEQHARDPEVFQAHIKMWESKIRPVETGYEQGALGHNDPN